MKKGKQKGYILVYSVSIMSFVLVFITLSMGLLSSTTQQNRLFLTEIQQRSQLDYIASYIADKDYAKASTLAEQYGYTISQSQTQNNTIYKITKDQKVYFSVIIDLADGKVSAYGYGDLTKINS